VENTKNGGAVSYPGVVQWERELGHLQPRVFFKKDFVDVSIYSDVTNAFS
jgi:hypothetical protein